MDSIKMVQSQIIKHITGATQFKIKLVDLSKIEIKTIIEALQFQMVESESLDDFNDKVNEEVGLNFTKF